MIGWLRSRLGDESGFSLVELMVSLILSGMIAMSLIAVFSSLSQNSADLTANAAAQSDAREIVADMVVEIRQASPPHPNLQAIEELTADRLAFSTSRYDGDGLIRVVYERSGCVEALCELYVYRYPSVGVHQDEIIFASEPTESSLLLGQVMNDQPLFTGIAYVGDPLVRTETSSCRQQSAPCLFPVVAVTLRARPVNTSAGGMRPVELREEVRLRNE